MAAALPAKGVYMALSAAAWLVVPSVRNHHSFRSVVDPVWLQVLVGCGLALLLVPAAPFIGRALGRPAPEGGLLLVLGVGMAFAAGSWVLLQLRLVREAMFPWVPPTVGLVAIAGLSLAFRTSDGLAVAMLAGGGIGLLAGLVMLAVEVRRRPIVAVDTRVSVVHAAEPSAAEAPAETPVVASVPGPTRVRPSLVPGPFSYPVAPRWLGVSVPSRVPPVPRSRFLGGCGPCRSSPRPPGPHPREIGTEPDRSPAKHRCARPMP